MNAAPKKFVMQRDLLRITSLSKRPPINCERDKKRRWVPTTQALVEVMTEKFTRGPRLSCGCRKRYITAGNDGALTVAHTPSPGAAPQAPLQTTVAAFCADNVHDKAVCLTVSALRPGQSVELEGLGALYCLTELNAVQSWILRELPVTQGIHGLVSVGGGKTVAGILAPLAMPSHVKVVVLLAKPDQRIHYRNAYLRLREHFRVPTMMFDEADSSSYIVPGTPQLHFIPYSRLSRPDSTQLLEQKMPDAVIADECFTYSTYVQTDSGPIKIGDIVEGKLKVNALSRNNNGTLEFRPVVRWLKRKTPSKLALVTHELGSFVCTPEHKIWTENNGYVKAGNIRGENLCFLPKHISCKTEEELKQILLCRMPNSDVEKSEPELEARNCKPQMRRMSYGLHNPEERCSHSKILFELVFLQKLQQKARYSSESEDENGAAQPATGGSSGYVCKIQQTSSYNTVPGMRELIFSPIEREKHQNILLQEVCLPVSENESEYRKGELRQEKPGIVAAHEEEQSHAHARSQRENDELKKRANLFVTRRQRHTYGTSEDFGRSFGMAYRTSDSDQTCARAVCLPASLLQSGHSRYSHTNGYRGRWEDSQYEEMEISRQEKNGDTERSRVVSVEILEQGSDGRFERCTGESEAVYDLEIADNHNYFADGTLVSNCHLLANRGASRTMRFLRLMANRSDILFCNWSGSTIKKSIKDASHLAAHALGLGSPYPILPDEVDQWAAVIDPSNMPDTKSQTAADLYMTFAGIDIYSEKAGLKFLYGAKDTNKLREAFRERMITTPGVVSTVSSSVNCSITISKRKTPEIPKAVKEALAMVRGGTRPDEEILLTPLDVISCARNVSAGFYEYFAYPRQEDPALIIEWFAARKIWNKAVRSKLALGQPHLDSPLLCFNAAERAWRKPAYDGDLPVWREPSWLEWSEIQDKVQPDPRVRWIDDYLAQDAAKWAKENIGIIWCESRAFGLKVAQLAGLPYHAGGLTAEAEILAEDGKRSVIASINAHGTGRDGLQYLFNKQLIAEVPASSDRWEQLLGRLAREGQPADTIETEVYLHVTETQDAMMKAVRYAEYVEATTPNSQLLLASDLDFEL